MAAWHKPGQPVVCVGHGWRNVFLPFVKADGPADGEISMITAVGRFLWRTYFKLFGFGELRFDARRFRPVYPTIVDDLRKLDAPTPDRVKEDA